MRHGGGGSNRHAEKANRYGSPGYTGGPGGVGASIAGSADLRSGFGVSKGKIT